MDTALLPNGRLSACTVIGHRTAIGQFGVCACILAKPESGELQSDKEAMTKPFADPSSPVGQPPNVDRRAALRGATSLAALAAGAAFASLPAAARTTSSTLPVADPYAAAVSAGPSSVGVEAVGETAAVPGTPYIVPTAERWSAVALITTGNTIKGYAMTGVPDGLGAFDNQDGTITVLMNHEIEAGHGSTRQHGGNGAFVSCWIIDTSTLEVMRGRDFIERPDRLYLWKGKNWINRGTDARKPLPAKPSPQPITPGAPPAATATVPPAATATAAPASPIEDDTPVIKLRDLDRLCSADLPPIAALYNRATRKGYNGYIFLNGEEGDNSANRAFAWVVADGTVHQLPAFSFGTPGDDNHQPPQWENLLANAATGDTTVVMANSDGGPSEVYCYIGHKQSVGTPIMKAGLTNGRIYSLAVQGVGSEDRDTNVGIAKSLLGKGQGKRVKLAKPHDGTGFLRPEDGAWDTRNLDVYFFVTTDRNNFAADGSVHELDNATQIGRSRLWAVTFDDVRKIAVDGSHTAKIELLLDGTEGGDMFDNITVDQAGMIYLCEDTGEARHNGKIWAYDTNNGEFATIMRFNPAMFGDIVGKDYTPPRPPFVDDKETSGILDVTALFATAKWFRAGSTVLLVDVQAHFNYDGDQKLGQNLYEGGQLLLLVKAPA